jgi:hypothetical protein
MITLQVNELQRIIIIIFFLLALQPLWALACFQFPDLFTIGRIPWTGDQLVARPLPKHLTAQTQNKHIYTPNIYALGGIRTHDYVPDRSALRRLIRNWIWILRSSDWD